MEMTYSRHDHEAWLRGPGRVDLETARKEIGQGPFTEEEFEEEVETQMELFNRCPADCTARGHSPSAAGSPLCRCMCSSGLKKVPLLALKSAVLFSV